MKVKNRAISLLLSAALLCVPVSVLAEDIETNDLNMVNEVDASDASEGQRYQDYLSQFPDAAYPAVEVLAPAANAAVTNGEIKAEYEGKQQVVTIDETGEVSFTVNVAEEGFYSLSLTYNSVLSKFSDYRFMVLIDGQLPHELAQSVCLRKVWRDTELDENGDFIKNGKNDIDPEQEEVLRWQTEYFYDVDGRTQNPMSFYFSAGSHTVTLQFDRGNIAVYELKLSNPAQVKTYEEALRDWEAQGVQRVEGVDPILIECEKMDSKSSASIRPTTERSSAATSPQDPAAMLFNCIGEDQSFSSAGEWVSYKVTVQKEGLYHLGFRAKQNFVRGIRCGRELWINGEIQYEDLKNINFAYDSGFYLKTIDTDSERLVYLKSGENTLTIRVNAQYADIRNLIMGVVSDANALYRDIIMITGVNPDEYNDYQLDRIMPGLMDQLRQFSRRLDDIMNQLLSSGFQKGGEIVSVEQFKTVVDSFIEKPETIPLRLEPYISAISTLSSFYYTLGSQPLCLDYLLIYPDGAVLPEVNYGFFTNVAYLFRQYIATYFEDYNQIGNAGGEEALNVWINMGRDQAEIIKKLVENDFSPNYGVDVTVNLVQQALIPATLSGDGPDISLFTTSIDTINLAVRNTLTDLSSFSDFEDVADRFQDNSVELYTYNDQVFGLPVTEAFYMMFYRKDILDELDIKVPDTWQEFNNALVTLQRNNLTVGIPSPDSEVDASTGGVQFAMFETLLMQNDASYYGDHWWTSGLSSPDALNAFKQITDFYSKYSVPSSFDFYSRFRTGEMALAIQRYSAYNQLMIAAPEIRGLWKMAPIPGTVKEDGTIDRSMSAVGTSAIMFQKTKNQEAGWQFLKWFTSAEIQSEYGRQVELQLGTGARPETANIEAFSELPWSQQEKEMLLTQWENLKIMPLTPVSYYVNRNVTNAFRKVVYQGDNSRETLNYYNSLIEREMARKRSQIKE